MTYGFRAALLLAAAVLAVHLVTNHRYGFHRDELQVIDDAHDLAWGYVVYPPLTPAVARLSMELFGPSLTGLRFFTALAMSIVIVLAALMARDLGGSDAAQILAAAMAAIAPIAVIQGALFQYVAFDFLWWVVIAWFVIRLIRSGDPRWWIGIGAAIGLGMMTRYTMAFFVAGLVAGVLLTPLRRHLRSPWLWGGVAVSLLLFLPNLIWQIRNDFITFEFLRSISARDVEIGRTKGFLLEQLFVPANPFTIPWWIAGLWFLFRSREPRALGWMFVVPLLLFVAMQGRSYYMGPAYPMLLAAGAVVWERWGKGRVIAVICVLLGAAMSAALMLPLAPVGSPWFRFTAGVQDNFAEEIGWPELVQQVATIYHGLAPEEKERTAIYASNYGEAGAINLYGPRHGLPRAISGINSHWKRGYGSPPPETVIVLGSSKERAGRRFRSCEVAGIVSNRWGVENEESRDHPEIVVCRGPLEPWPMMWPRLRSFG
ncbi:MAG TPA: glycosyltransferase family 39 protein [Thermoanaerobaculia bacterium]|nr:glycosyltransferase family 39 protein [Thermoanaerobaculia bacterium]